MNKKINSYRDLIVWQKAIDLVIIVYQLTAHFPKAETYGLTSQMRRASVSIASNIAEGSRRKTRKEYHYFLTISYGSGAELETLIEISKKLALSNDLDFLKADAVLEEIMKMLNSIIDRLSHDNYNLHTKTYHLD